MDTETPPHHHFAGWAAWEALVPEFARPNPHLGSDSFCSSSWTWLRKSFAKLSASLSSAPAQAPLHDASKEIEALSAGPSVRSAARPLPAPVETQSAMIACHAGGEQGKPWTCLERATGVNVVGVK